MFSRKKVSNVTPTINLRNKGERTIIHCVAWKAVLETTTCAEKTVTWSSRGPHLHQGTKASRMNAACKHVNIYVRWLAFHVSIITLFKMSRGVVQNNTGGVLCILYTVSSNGKIVQNRRTVSPPPYWHWCRAFPSSQRSLVLPFVGHCQFVPTSSSWNPSHHWSVLLFYHFVISKPFCQWNHAICNLAGLPFALSIILWTFFQVTACISSMFAFITEQYSVG